MLKAGTRVSANGFQATINGWRYKYGQLEYYCSFSAWGEWIPARNVKEVS